MEPGHHRSGYLSPPRNEAVCATPTFQLSATILVTGVIPEYFGDCWRFLDSVLACFLLRRQRVPRMMLHESLSRRYCGCERKLPLHFGSTLRIQAFFHFDVCLFLWVKLTFKLARLVIEWWLRLACAYQAQMTVVSSWKGSSCFSLPNGRDMVPPIYLQSKTGIRTSA